ncbi:MAG TPA: hypothetical protein VNP92_19350 [Actinophytocola sp.]|nr:hypothetical protein [Actinophytocola sp.]
MTHGSARLLGRKCDIERFLARNPDADVTADFLNLRGTMADGRRGAGGWTWTRNKRFILDAIARGEDVLLVTDPGRPLRSGGNTYQRELRYLVDRGYRWERLGEHWRVHRARVSRAGST